MQKNPNFSTFFTQKLTVYIKKYFLMENRVDSNLFGRDFSDETIKIVLFYFSQKL